MLEKNQTGIASEFYVAGELSRLGYNVTVTFGNTKAIDLLIQKDSGIYKVQVKGIQSRKSICWNIDKRKVTNDLYIVLVNLHVDEPSVKPEFFVLQGNEVKELFNDTNNEKRSWLDYNKIKRLDKYQDRWGVFGEPEVSDVNEEWH